MSIDRNIAIGLMACASFTACELVYPEIIIVNKTAEHVLLKTVSFNGCLWEGVLAYGDATAPGLCLPGSARVHFEKFDASNYCIQQATDGTFEGVCPCDDEGDTGDTSSTDPGMINTEPFWFNYMTVQSYEADNGDFIRIEITMDEIEQDFDVVGPYGH